MSENLPGPIPRILVANGVNLDLLGRREPDLYGHQTLQHIEEQLKAQAKTLATLAGFSSCNLSFVQTNAEDKFLEAVSGPFDGIVLNPGAWTHTSLALADRLRGLCVPYVEVHLSHLIRRKDVVRQVSLTAPGSIGTICGLGGDSYSAGLLALLQHLKNRV